LHNTLYIIFTALSLFIFVLIFNSNDMEYPITRTEKTSNIYFDTTIIDSFQWLEDDYADDTREWVKKQNSFTDSYIKKIPFKNKIKKRLTEIWNYPSESLPFKKGNKFYYYHNDGLQNQAILYVKNTIKGESKVLINPNDLSDDGIISIGGIYFSKDNNYLGYSLNKSGSDWQEFQILNLNTGKLLSDHLKWIKFSGMSWFGDGFFYKKYPKSSINKNFSASNINPKIYFHHLGEDQSKDKLIFSNPNEPNISPWISVSDDEKIMYLYRSSGTYGNSLSFKIVDNDQSQWIPIIDDFISEISVVEHNNNNFIAITDRNNPYNQLVKIDKKNPEEDNWEVIINGTRKEVLKEVNIVGNKIFAHFFKNILSLWKVYDLNGQYLYTIDLPGKGIVDGFRGRMNQKTTWFSFNNSVNPTTLYEYHIPSNQSTIYKKPSINFSSDDYILRQEFYPSKDGTLIPIFICHKKNLEMDGKRPTLLYGYGGFNISIEPYFNKSNTILYENDGVYAIANIRGGGEYGEEWHKGGMYDNKQNVFDDFTYAGKYLINENITSKNYLAIQGQSNGGLLIGAVINQNPDLFRVAFPEVGVMDMLRYEKFTIGHAWSVEYGSIKEMKHFKNIIKYSPLHNIKKNIQYPSVFIYTADHDDRVVPAHSFKYAANLQSLKENKNPVLIRVGINAGHGAGKPTKKIIEEHAEKWAFLFNEMGLKY